MIFFLNSKPINYRSRYFTLDECISSDGEANLWGKDIRLVHASAGSPANLLQSVHDSSGLVRNELVLFKGHNDQETYLIESVFTSDLEMKLNGRFSDIQVLSIFHEADRVPYENDVKAYMNIELAGISQNNELKTLNCVLVFFDDTFVKGEIVFRSCFDLSNKPYFLGQKEYRVKSL